MSMQLARYSCYALLGVILAGLGASWDSWQLWTVLALAWVLEQIQYIDFKDMLAEAVADMKRRGQLTIHVVDNNKDNKDNTND